MNKPAAQSVFRVWALGGFKTLAVYIALPVKQLNRCWGSKETRYISHLLCMQQISNFTFSPALVFSLR